MAKKKDENVYDSFKKWYDEQQIEVTKEQIDEAYKLATAKKPAKPKKAKKAKSAK